MEEKQGFLKKAPIVVFLLSLALDMFCLKLIRGSSVWVWAGARFALAAKSFLFAYLISGRKALSYWNGKDTLKTFWKLKPMWIAALLLCVLASLFSPDTGSLNPNWPVKLLAYALLMISVGFFEELSFRVVLNNALLNQFRKNPQVFVIITAACLLIFGWFHVAGADVSTPMKLLTAVMKVVSVGITGLVFLVVFWKSGNILGCIITHTLFDFATVVSNVFYQEGMDMSVNYVLDGAAGLYAVVIYGVESVLLLVFIWWLCKKDKKMPLDLEKVREEF